MPFEYTNNAIIEAIWEFAPVAASGGATVLAELKNHFAQDFNGRQDVVASSAGFEMQTGPNGISTARPLPAGPPRQRMWNTDGSRLVQFGADMLAFNALSPYTHFSHYLPAIRSAFDAYSRLATPVSVRFLGHRYINRIVLPSLDARPEDFFSVYPALHAAAGAELHPPFALQVQTEEIQRGQVVLSLTYQGPDADRRPQYLLDVYARTVDAPNIEFRWERVFAWHQVAHAAIARTFDFVLRPDGYTLLGRRETAPAGS